jgi:hypothetical protein
VKTYSILLALLLIPALACSTASLAESLASSGSVLYQDVFSNPESGWDALSADQGSAEYVNDAYRIVVNQAQVNLWTHPGLNFFSIHEEISMMSAAGPTSNRMGLICRLMDDNNFYFFVISADGTYGIGKMKDGQTSLLNADQMQPHPAILTGSQINRIRADCVGDNLTLYVNENLITSVTDSDFPSGDVGILAGTFDQPGADIYFDNFVVYKP